MNQEEWDKLMNNVEDNHHCLLLGDFNAHHRAWNCNSDDANGKRLLNAIDQKGLFIHNTSTFSRINPSSGNMTNIDIIISTINLTGNLSTTVFDETHGSDHFPVLTTLSTIQNIYIKKSFKIKSTRTNWTGVLEGLTEKFTQFYDTEFSNASPSQKYEIFLNTVTSIIKQNTPKKNNRTHYKHNNPVIWWDAECDKVLRLRKSAFKKWDFSKKLDDYIEYKRQAAIAKRTFKTKKKKIASKSLRNQSNLIPISPMYGTL